MSIYMSAYVYSRIHTRVYTRVYTHVYTHVYTQAEASLASFIGSMNYSDTLHVSALNTKARQLVKLVRLLKNPLLARRVLY